MSEPKTDTEPSEMDAKVMSDAQAVAAFFHFMGAFGVMEKQRPRPTYSQIADAVKKAIEFGKSVPPV